MKTLTELDNPLWLTAEVSQLQICTSAGTQYRDVLSPAVFIEYKVAMIEGVSFPPIRAVFDGAKYIVVDGFHRLLALSLMGRPTVTVEYVEGDLADARYLALRSNTKHGLPRSNADKEKVVTAALSHPLTQDLPDNQIARICGVSRSFVGAVRNPEAKKNQSEAKQRHTVKKAKEIEVEAPPEISVNTNQISTEGSLDVPIGGEAPDEAELLANEKQHEADMEMLANLLDADDKMKHLYDEVQRLTHLVVMKELRIKELMNEKSAAIKMAKVLQREIEKLRWPDHRRMTRSARMEAAVHGHEQVLRDVQDGFGL